MKLFLLIALILLVTVSFGDCGVTKSPSGEKSPKSPKGDSDKQLADAIGVLSLDGHDQTSPAYQIVPALREVISKNRQMYNQIKEYVDSFTKHDADPSPVELTIIKMKMTIDFSEHEELNMLKNQFNTYQPKLDELLKNIEPAYQECEKLAESVIDFIKSETKLADLTTEPKIDPKLTEKLQKEAEKVTEIFQEFEKVMEKFQMKTYIQKLKNVQEAIVELKDKKMQLDEAEQIFVKNVQGSEELMASNVATLDAALKIHYTDLAKANQELQGIVKKAMHAHEPAKHAKK